MSTKEESVRSLQKTWEEGTQSVKTRLASTMLESADFTSLRTMGTTLWPLEKPVEYLDTCDINCSAKLQFWRKAVETDDPTLLHHLSTLMPLKWNAFLNGSLGSTYAEHDLCIYTITSKSLNILEHLFKRDWPNAASLSDTWLLTKAAAVGWEEGVTYLLQQGVDSDSALFFPTSLARTALSHAAHNGHFHLFGLLIEAGADPMKQDWAGRTAFSHVFEAIRRKNVNLKSHHLALLLRCNPDLETPVEKTSFKSILDWCATLPDTFQAPIHEARLRQESRKILQEELSSPCFEQSRRLRV